jgi:hypothetical protein
MAKSPGRHVTKNPNDGWDVKKPGSERSTGHAGTQAEAERIAKDQVAKEGGGEVVIHRPTGAIRDSDTVAPARDPNPPKDTKH